MDDFTLFDTEGARNDETRARVPIVAVEITWSCWLTQEWEEMFAWHVISLSKFKLEEQVCFAAKVNIMQIQRLQDGWYALVKYIEDINLDQNNKKGSFVCLFLASKNLLLVYNR